MKFNFKYTLFFFSLIILSSCGSDYATEDYFELEELPNYVAFGDGTTNNAVLETLVVDEDAATASFIIEAPAGTLSDVNITYDISGTAVAGIDYNIVGAGSITLAVDENDFQNRDQVSLDIEILTDGVVDGTKTLTLTLTSASNAEGTLAVGRGGTDFLKSVDLEISDVDM
ncbi:MAG: hypothetical protein AB8H03_04840 [Saprospiraceae bacterium]